MKSVPSTANLEIFARVLFSRNLADSKLCENQTFADAKLREN